MLHENFITLKSAGILCAVIAVLVYINTMDCGLCFDDEKAIKDNSDLRPDAPWRNLLKNDFWGNPINSTFSHKSYRPLTVATFRLNYLLHELQPMGYHLVNVLLHSAVCYLYVQLCGVVFSAVWPALIAGLLFAVHPIHTEAVTGVVGRADVLAGLFFTGSILVYMMAVGSEGWLGHGKLVISLILCLCSALSKEIGITAVAVFVMYEFFILNKMDLLSTLKLLRTLPLQPKKIPKWFVPFLLRALTLFMLAVGFLVFRLKLNQGHPLFFPRNNPAIAFNTPYRQLHWSYLVFFNIWLLLNPSHLCAEYAMGTIPGILSFADPRNLLTLVTFAAITLLGLYGVSGIRRHQNVVLFSLSLMVFPFIPASNLFFPVGFVIAERVLYLPSMGFCMLVGWGAWHILNKYDKLLGFHHLIKVGIVYLLLVHAAKVMVRNRDWYSSLTFYHSALRFSPCSSNAKLINNLASAYKLSENYSLAESLYRHAIEISPDYMRARMELGNTLELQLNYAEAEQVYRKVGPLVANRLAEGNQFEKSLAVDTCQKLADFFVKHTGDMAEAYKFVKVALKGNPTSDEAYTTKGNILLKMNRPLESIEALGEAIRLKPNSASAYSLLGDAYSALGDTGGAERQYRIALDLDSNHNLTKFKLAYLHVRTGEKKQYLEAEQLLFDVLAAEPMNGNATMCMGLVCFGLKKYSEAKEMFTRTLEISPRDESALYNLAVVHKQLDNCSGAVRYFSTLLTLRPDHPKAPTELGTCYLQMREWEKGREIFEEVLRKDPTNKVALNNLGIIMVEMQETERAVQLFSKLTTLDPDNEAVKQQLRNLQLHQTLASQIYTDKSNTIISLRHENSVDSEL